MILLDLFLGFLRVGCFAFGGAYGAIPLIREVVLDYGWLTDETITYMIAVAESTPGPIMVNLATYIGSTQAGLAGSVIATAAVVLPSFFVILLLTKVLKTALNRPGVQAVLRGMKPAIVGVILATGVYMVISHCIAAPAMAPDLRAIAVTLFLVAAMALYRLLCRRKLSPILLILLSAAAGVAAYGMW